jgi:Ca2+-transporting ATPase
VPALVLLVVWEVGKLAVRWAEARRRRPAEPSPAARQPRSAFPAPRQPLSSRDVSVPGPRGGS